MSISEILQFAGTAIYIALGLVAVYGVFSVILLIRRIAQKRFSSKAAADQFLTDVYDRLDRRDLDGIVQLCDTPSYWSKAVPQLIIVAIQSQERRIARLRRLLGERFERDVLSDLEFQTSWIATIVKAAPMLGLLGTVVGMINAFAEIAGMRQAGSNPGQLADDISLALSTTAIGLTIAIPLVLAGNLIHIRIGKLQDSVQQQLGEFVNRFDAVVSQEEGEPS